MKLLKDYLAETLKGEGADLGEIISVLASAVKEIARALEFVEATKTGTVNDYGEEQMRLDVFANNLLVEKLGEVEAVHSLASEELHGELKIGNGEYSVCFDPLDGSSLLDVNLAVGTIVGVYKSKGFAGRKGSEQVCAMAVLYGPKTTLVLTVRDGVYEFSLNNEGDFFMTKERLTLTSRKMFAPGNLRACADNPKYLELVNFWIQNAYTLRYSGGMVPDIYQILIKGGGVFSYPGTIDAPNGKLRLLVECAPMALLVEEAGGYASDGEVRILDKEITDVTLVSPIFIGTKEEVARCEEYL